MTMNSLTGPIHPNIGNMPLLEYLYLSNNELTGTIPTQIGKLVELRSLWLGPSTLTGALPTELGNLLNVQDVYMNESELSGSIPSEIGNMESLGTCCVCVSFRDFGFDNLALSPCRCNCGECHIPIHPGGEIAISLDAYTLTLSHSIDHQCHFITVKYA